MWRKGLVDSYMVLPFRKETAMLIEGCLTIVVLVLCYIAATHTWEGEYNFAKGLLAVCCAVSVALAGAGTYALMRFLLRI